MSSKSKKTRRQKKQKIRAIIKPSLFKKDPIEFLTEQFQSCSFRPRYWLETK